MQNYKLITITAEDKEQIKQLGKKVFNFHNKSEENTNPIRIMENYIEETEVPINETEKVMKQLSAILKKYVPNIEYTEELSFLEYTLKNGKKTEMTDKRINDGYEDLKESSFRDGYSIEKVDSAGFYGVKPHRDGCSQTTYIYVDRDDGIMEENVYLKVNDHNLVLDGKDCWTRGALQISGNVEHQVNILGEGKRFVIAVYTD